MQDIIVILVLVFMEGLLSFDNAIVLALLVKHLPHEQQKKALTYGIGGAFLFRLLSLFCLNFLMHNVWIKALGGLYLLYLAYSHFFGKDSEEAETTPKQLDFWKTIVMVELMDIAFSVDSIMASVAMSPKVWVVFIGGVLGIITMRLAAGVFIKLIDKYPRLETTAHILITIIGLKLCLESVPGLDIDFHSSQSPAFWAFWVSFAGAIATGFTGEKAIT